jgi:hypothetical protein
VVIPCHRREFVQDRGLLALRCDPVSRPDSLYQLLFCNADSPRHVVPLPPDYPAGNNLREAVACGAFQYNRWSPPDVGSVSRCCLGSERVKRSEGQRIWAREVDRSVRCGIHRHHFNVPGLFFLSGQRVPRRAAVEPCRTTFGSPSGQLLKRRHSFSASSTRATVQFQPHPSG